MSNIEITDESKRFLDAVDSGASPIFLTGKAGTGKSTLLRHLRESTLRNVAVVAPTGLAALNVGGQTIHSFFRFQPRAIMDKDSIRELYGFPRRLFERLQLLIIDEVSMVRVDLMDCIDKFLRVNGRRPNMSFGGVQVVMIGDLFQLPPVVKQGTEHAVLQKIYGTPFFFGAPVFKEAPMQMFELTKVYRQEDNEFIECLNQIREGGDAFMAAIKKINDTCFIGNDHYEGVTMVGTNDQADAINVAELRRLPGDIRAYKADRSGSLAEPTVKEDRLPAPETLRLKEGARVMILRNDIDGRRYVNGTVGTIVRLPDIPLMPVTIRIDAKDENSLDYEDVCVCRNEWHQNRVELLGDHYIQSVVGTFEQYPLQLAYAMTIHKVQGKTLESVLLDTGRGMFADGQLYVALSRVKSINGLKLRKRLEVRDVQVNPDVIEFYDQHHNTQVIQGGLFHE